MLSSYIILVLLGIARSVQGWDWVAENLKCSRFRAVINTHKNLFTSGSDLDEMCRQQEVFFRCLHDVISSSQSKTDKLPPEIKRAEELTEELCSIGPWQQKYLGAATCINEQFTEFCTNPEFLATIRLEGKIRSTCNLREEAVNCIAATLSLHCGPDAVEIFESLLEMNSDGGRNCYSIGPELLFPPDFPDVKDSEKTIYKEVYNSLLKRIGTIPEQDGTDDSTTVDELRYTTEDEVESQLNFKTIAEDYTSEDSVYKRPEFMVCGGDDYYDLDSSKLRRRSFDLLDTDEHVTQYMGPRLTFRYYGNGTTYTYARIPFFENVEGIACMHKNDEGEHEFVCAELHRQSEPSCMEGGRTEGPRTTPIIPEEIDPEFGAKFYEMAPYSYQFRPIEEICSDASTTKSVPSESTERHKAQETNAIENLKEAIGNFYSFYAKSASDPASISEAIDAKELETDHEDDEKVDSLKEQSEDFVTPLSLIKQSVGAITPSIPEACSKSRDEVLKQLKFLGIFLSPRAMEISSIISREARSLVEDFLSVTESATSSGPGLRYSWPGREKSELESLHCSRVNECHPNATEVVKCTFKLKGVGGSWTTGCPATVEGKDSAFSCCNSGPVKLRQIVRPRKDVDSEEPASMLVPEETSKLHLSLPIAESELYFAETSLHEDPAEEAQLHTNFESEDEQLVFVESDVLYPVTDLETEGTIELVRINSVGDEYQAGSSDVSPAEDSDHGENSLLELEGIIRENIDNITVE